MRFERRRLSRRALAHTAVTLQVLAFLLARTETGSAQLIWDGNGAQAGSGGPGDWNTTSLNWNNGSAYVAWTTGASGRFQTSDPNPQDPAVVRITEQVVLERGKMLKFDAGKYRITDNLATPPALKLGGAQQTGVCTIEVSADAITPVPVIAARIGGDAPLQFTGGHLRLTGANSYSGGTTIFAGTLSAEPSNATDRPLGTGTVTFRASAAAAVLSSTDDCGNEVPIRNDFVVDANSTAAVSLGIQGTCDAAQGEFSGNISIGAPIKLVAYLGNVRFIGELSGASSVTTEVDLPGSVRLLRAQGNSYQGGTTIKKGSLFVSNTGGSATGTGAVTVGEANGQNTGTLEGKGIITGSVTVTNRGTVNMDSSDPDVLQTGNLEFLPGSEYSTFLKARLKAIGSVKIDGATLRLASIPQMQDGQKFVLIENDGNDDAVTGDLFVDESGQVLAEGALIDVRNDSETTYRLKLTYKGNASGPDPAEANDVMLISQGVTATEPVSWGQIKRVFR